MYTLYQISPTISDSANTLEIFISAPRFQICWLNDYFSYFILCIFLGIGDTLIRLWCLYSLFAYYERYIHVNSWKGSTNVESNVTKKLIQILKRDISNVPWTLKTKSTYAEREWGYVPEKNYRESHDRESNARIIEPRVLCFYKIFITGRKQSIF